MTSKHTPFEVLREMRAGKRKPWWADRLGDRMEAHLARVMWQGKPLLHTKLSSKACEAVLEEALNVVRLPDANDPVGEMLHDMRVAGNA